MVMKMDFEARHHTGSEKAYIKGHLIEAGDQIEYLKESTIALTIIKAISGEKINVTINHDQPIIDLQSSNNPTNIKLHRPIFDIYKDEYPLNANQE